MSQPQRKLAERAACSSSKPVRALTLAVCMFTALSGAARAESLPTRDECEEDPACADHVQAGLQLSKAGQYAAALVSYRAAQAIRPVPWLLINIGRVLHRMGKPQQAIEQYRTYLQLAPGDDPERRRAAEGYLKQAESDLEPAPAEVKPATVPLARPPCRSTSASGSGQWEAALPRSQWGSLSGWYSGCPSRPSRPNKPRLSVRTSQVSSLQEYSHESSPSYCCQ